MKTVWLLEYKAEDDYDGILEEEYLVFSDIKKHYHMQIVNTKLKW